MKKYFTLILFSIQALFHVTSAQGKVGINTVSPSAMLHVKDSSVVFTGAASLPGSPGQPPVLGNGIRMMWYPDKAAIRAGGVGASQWDRDSIGNYSSGIGLNTIAKGYGSVALGHTTSATNTASVALGNGTVATGIAATALGSFTDATGTSSVTMGNSTIASGALSVAMGSSSIASGTGALSIGSNNFAIGNYSSSFGINTKSRSYAAFILGRYNDTTSISSAAWNSSDPLFIIGNGSSDISRNNAVTVLKKGFVGINTSDPQAYLHVNDSSVVFTGGASIPGAPGQPPVLGNGIRMMWYPDKAAFRAGMATDNSWNKDSIGSYSVAMGRGTKAIGPNSTAFGYQTKASGSYSTVLGISNLASGYGSFASGYSAEAINNYATAMGYNTTASGTYTTTLGYSTTASGTTATAMGTFTSASGSYTTAMGFSTTASGSSATAMGNSTTASDISATAMGDLTTASGPYSTAIGNGTTASGSSATAMGYNTSSSGNSATAMGYNTSALGSATTAMGNLTSASGPSATAMGYNTSASGAYAISLGHSTIASGYASTASGYFGKASGYYSNAMGFNTMAKSYASVTIGRYNDTTSISSASWNTADPVFIIGNGSSNTSRSNAFTVLKNGNVGINTKIPDYGLHITSTDPTDGGWVDGIVLQNTSSSTGEVAISMAIAGASGTGANFWHVGLNQDRNFRWCYGTGFFGSDTKMSLDSLGNLWVDGVYSYSDINLKRDFSPIDNALQKISLLNGYHYYWNTPGKDTGLQSGIIAQEVEKVMPELVKTDEEGTKSVNYSGLLPYLIEAMKTLKEENEQLREELEEIKALLND